jgi:yeast amino acid transporter
MTRDHDDMLTCAGTATFVSISNGLIKGGPGSLLLAYTLYTCMLGLVNNSMAEMASYMPVSGGFIRMAGHWVDPAMGFWVGWYVVTSIVDAGGIC